jgi:hypothetical protein
MPGVNPKVKVPIRAEQKVLVLPPGEVREPGAGMYPDIPFEKSYQGREIHQAYTYLISGGLFQIVENGPAPHCLHGLRA